MTIATSVNKVQYVGDGTRVAFPYTFKIFASADLRVVRRSATGVETVLVLGTDYTVTGAGADEGGTVTLTGTQAATPPSASEKVLVKRLMALTQETDWVDNDPFPAATIEGAMDKVICIAQQLQEQIDRSVITAETATGTVFDPDALADAVAATQSDAAAAASSASAAAASASTAANAASTAATNAAAAVQSQVDAATAQATAAAGSATAAASAASTASANAAAGVQAQVDAATAQAAAAAASAAEAASAVSSGIPTASTTVRGGVILATDAEVLAGADTGKAVTAAGVASAYLPLAGGTLSGGLNTSTINGQDVSGGVATLGPDGKVPAAQLPAITGDVAVIRTPSITSPADGAVLTTSTPTIVGDAYRNVYGVAQASMVVEVATDALFATVVYAHTTTGAATSHAMPAGHIEPSGSYYIGVRYTDDDGAESARGVAHVTASAQLEHVATPTLTAPVAGATVYEQPTLTSSAFAVTSGADTHAASRWQVKTSAGSWDTPLWDSGEVASLTSVTVPAGYLTAGGNGYDFRVTHKGTALGWSDWSPSVAVVSAANFANIIGVACTATGGGGGSWVWVDVAGNAVTPAVGYFNGHPVFGGIADVTVDGQVMVKIPKFYIKRVTLAAGAYSGKEAWFVSDQPSAGFRLHPAFYNAGVEVAQIYVGKYQASSDGSKLKSVAGVLPAVSTSLTAFQGLATARNVSGVTGFMLWSIYHWSAIQWLYLVEMATMDSQTKTGAGRTGASSAANVDASDVAQATYRGIVGLWGNVYQWMDGLKTDGTQICLWDNVGNKTWITTGRSRTAAAGWIYPLTFMVQSGGSYNFADVFLGDTGPTTNSGATAPDGQYLDSASAYFPIVGGHWGGGVDAGLWCVRCSYSASDANTNFGARLAKV